MQTPIIETERMILRPITVADAADIFERWTSDERVSKYVKWCTHASVNDTIEWLKHEEESLLSDTSYQWGFTLKDSGYLFGSGGIFSHDDGVFELGTISCTNTGIRDIRQRQRRQCLILQ